LSLCPVSNSQPVVFDSKSSVCNVAACPTYVIAPVDELIANLPSSFPAVIEYVIESPSRSDPEAVAIAVPLEIFSAYETASILEIDTASFTFVILIVLLVVVVNEPSLAATTSV